MSWMLATTLGITLLQPANLPVIEQAAIDMGEPAPDVIEVGEFAIFDPNPLPGFVVRGDNVIWQPPQYFHKWRGLTPGFYVRQASQSHSTATPAPGSAGSQERDSFRP